MASMQDKACAILAVGLVTNKFRLVRGARVAVCDLSAQGFKQLHTSLPSDQIPNCFRPNRKHDRWTRR